jgi:PAS domain S-box-containing protein
MVGDLFQNLTKHLQSLSHSDRYQFAKKLFEMINSFNMNEENSESVTHYGSQDLNVAYLRFRYIVEFFPLPIVVTDESGQFRYVNPAFTETFGYKIQDLPTDKIWSFKAYPDVEYRREILKSISHHEYDPKKPHERKIHCANGDVKDVIMQNITFGDEHLTFFRDITARRASEREIQKKDQEYRQIVENSRDMIFLLSNEFLIQKINFAVLDTLGYLESDLIGTHIFNYILMEYHPILNSMKDLNQSYLRKKQLFEVEFVKENSDKVSVELISQVIEKESKFIGLLAIARDITERKKLLEERTRQQKIESIGLLAGGLAHDFNNILVSILGNIDLLKLEDDNFTEEQKEICVDLENATNQARDLAKQLLTFSKGGVPIRNPANISDLVQKTTSFVLRGSNCKANLHFESDLPLVDIDSNQIGQVISNLLINAKQAMKDGGIIDISINQITFDSESLIPLKSGTYNMIQIRDHGTGIAKEHFPKIFDPYFSTKVGGNGLGLATSYSIVKNHGGYISFESELEKGTLFKVYLPTSKETIPTPELKQSTVKEKRKGNILVLDDDPKIHGFLHRIFAKWGYEMYSCYDGGEVVGIMKDIPFDLILMDLTIPGGMGGKETIKLVREISPNQKVVVFSGYSDDPILAEHEKYGFSDYLIKPFTIAQLQRICEKFI